MGTTLKAKRLRLPTEAPSKDATQQRVTDEKQVAICGETEPLQPGKFDRVEQLPITVEQ